MCMAVLLITAPALVSDPGQRRQCLCRTLSCSTSAAARVRCTCAGTPGRTPSAWLRHRLQQGLHQVAESFAPTGCGACPRTAGNCHDRHLSAICPCGPGHPCCCRQCCCCWDGLFLIAPCCGRPQEEAHHQAHSPRTICLHPLHCHQIGCCMSHTSGCCGQLARRNRPQLVCQVLGCLEQVTAWRSWLWLWLSSWLWCSL